MDNRIRTANVITTPDVLVVATEYVSKVYRSTAQVKGEAFLYIADSSKIGTNGVTLNTYGSYDGVTFFKQGTVTQAASTGAKQVMALAPFAPYFKVGVLSVAAGTGQAAGHGIVVDIVTVVSDMDQFHSNGQVLVDATTPATDIVSITARTFFESVEIYGNIVSGATITDFDYTVETSQDGVKWFVVETFSDLTAALVTKIYKNCGLLKYVRVVPSAFTTSGSAVLGVSLHGIGY